MSKKKSPAFQIYPANMLSDINYILLSFQQRGLLFHLTLLEWQHGSLPNDIQKLAVLCNIPTSASDIIKFTDDLNALAPFIEQTEADIFLKTNQEQREKQAEYAKVKSKAGKASAEKRWSKKRTIKPKKATNSTTNTKKEEKQLKQAGNEPKPSKTDLFNQLLEKIVETDNMDEKKARSFIGKQAKRLSDAGFDKGTVMPLLIENTLNSKTPPVVYYEYFAGAISKYIKNNTQTGKRDYSNY